MSTLSSLPALAVKTPLERQKEMMTLADLAQQGQYRQQQIIGEQQQNQMRQEQMRQQEVMNRALQEWDGTDYNSLPGLVHKHGGSAQTIIGLKSSIVEMYNKAAQSRKEDREWQADRNNHWIQALDNVRSLPVEQQPSALEQAKQKAVQSGFMTPQEAAQTQYTTPQGLDMARKVLMGQQSVLKEAEQAETVRHNKAMEARIPAGSDQTRFIVDYLGANNLPDTPANRQRAFDVYTQKTKIAPAQVRVEGLGNIREYPVIDTKNNNSLQYISATDLNQANRKEPGRYVPAGEGGKALNKTALLEDIRGNVQAVRDSLNNPKMPEFTADQRAQIAFALGGKEPAGVLQATIRGGALGNLTEEQQDYLINMAQLTENAMAMRSVLGAGQGSEDLRSAIRATIPGPKMPTKAYGLKQLQAFENVLNRLGRGVPNVPLRNQTASAVGTQDGGVSTSQVTHQYNPKTGKIEAIQ